MKTIRVPLVVLILCCFSSVKGDFFSEYFNDKVFGANPGPCPLDDSSCSINLETDSLPPAVAQIEFCFINNGFLRACDEIQNVVKSGFIELWDLQCEGIGIQDLTINPEQTSGDTVVTKILAENVQQRCRGKTRFTDVVLKISPITVLLDFHTDFTTTPSADGLTLSFDLVLGASGGFNNNLVDSGDVRNCEFEANLGLEVQDINYDRLEIQIFIPAFGADVKRIVKDNLTNLLLKLIESLLGAAVCGVVEQAGTLTNGDKGILTVFLDSLNERYDEITAPVVIDVRGTDAAFVANPESFGSTVQERDSSLNLADSNALELVSVTLNDFLGGDDVSPLRVNQAIDLLTDPDGTVFFDLSELDLNIEIPLSFANASSKVKTITAKGLDSIDFFSFLQNDFSKGGNGLDYTLTHQFGMQTFELLLTIELTIKRGSWVTSSSCGTLGSFVPKCNSDEEVFTFDYGLTVSDIDFEAAVLSAINVEEIKGIQVGQLVDHDLTDILGAAESVLSCIAPSVYALLFSDLKMSIGTISDPFVENFSGAGVDVLIENSVELISVLLKNLLTNDLPLIMRGPVRDYLNKVLREKVSDVDDLSQCPPYNQIPRKDPYVVFNQAPVDAVFPILNNVLGDFSADSDVDLNDLIQGLLSYYSTNAQDFPLSSAGKPGDWDTKAELTPLGQISAFEDNSFIRMEDLKLRNLNTISAFGADKRDIFPQGFTYQLEFGGADGEKLEIRFAFQIQSSNPTANEDFEFSILFEDFHIETVIDQILINLDSENRLKIEDLSHLPCLFSVIDGIDADEAKSKLSATNLNFNILFNNQDSGSTFRAALNELQSEFVNSASNERFTRVSNYFMDIGYHQGLSSINKLNYSTTPEGCTSVESDYSIVLNSLTGLGFLDFSKFQKKCLKEIPQLASIPQYEKEQLGYKNSVDELDGELLKLKDNVILKFVQSFFNIDNAQDSADGSALGKLLFSLANSSGNAFVDLFVFDNENEENINFEIDLSQPNPILDALGVNLKPTIDGNGFKAEAQLLRIKNLNKFLEKVKLFQTLSDFILQFEIGFSDGDPLEIEQIVLIEANSTIIDLAPAGSPPIEDIITVKIPVNGVQIKLQTFTAFRMDRVKELTVAHFININEDQEFTLTDFALNCFMKSYADGGLNIRSFFIDISAIGEPSVRSESNNILSPGVEGMFEEVGKLLVGFYSSAVPNICENCIKDYLNENFDERITKANEPGACPNIVSNVPISKDNELMRYSDSILVNTVQDFLKKNLYADDYKNWNELIRLVTSERLFDTKPFSSGVFELMYKDQSYGGMQIGLKNVFIQNLDTFTDVKLFEPIPSDSPDYDPLVDPYKVRLVLDYSGPTKYDFETSIIGYDFFTSADVVENDIGVELELTDLVFEMEMKLELNLNTLLKVQFNQVDTLNELPCLLTPIESFDVSKFNFSNGHISASARCSGRCDSDLLASVPQFSDESDEFNHAVDVFINFVVQYLESSPAERLINIALSSSEETCASIINGLSGLLDSGPKTPDVFLSLLYIFLLMMFLGMLALAYQYPRHLKRRKKIMKRFETDRNKEFDVTSEMQILSNELSSLALSPAIPKSAKIVIPVLCCLNIVAATLAVFQAGALTINVQISLLGMDTNTIDLVPLTIISTVNQMWATGSWPIAIMVLVASFFWPIMNNILLLFLWYTPSTVVPNKRRARCFEMLAMGTRWSFLDVFIVVVALGALVAYVELSGQNDLQFLDPRVFTLTGNVRPEAGIILLATVACTSLVANHFMTFFHGRTLEHNRKQYDAIAGNNKIPRKALAKKNLAGYKFSKRMVSQKKVNYLFFLHIVSGLLLFTGMILPVFTFETRGLGGLFLGELDKSQQLKTFSVVSLGAVISNGPTGDGVKDVSVFYFQFVYFLVTVVGPLVQFVVLTFLLKVKFSLRSLTMIMETGMIISYWAALDVILLGILMTVTQLETVTDFVVSFVTNDICTNIQGALELFVPDKEDASCLKVLGNIEIGALPLALGILGELFVLTVSMILAFRVVQDRYYFAYVSSGLRPREPRPTKMGYLRTLIYNAFTITSKSGLRRMQTKETSADDLDDSSALQAANPRFRQSLRGQSSTRDEEIEEEENPQTHTEPEERADASDEMSQLSSLVDGKRVEF